MHFGKESVSKVCQHFCAITNNMMISLPSILMVDNRVTQGDIPASTLFLSSFKNSEFGIYIRYCITRKPFSLTGFHSKKKIFSLVQDLLYADDCDLVADIQKIMDLYLKAYKAFGLLV